MTTYLASSDEIHRGRLYHLPWLFVIAIYTPIFNELYRSRWEIIDYTHAYFILPFVLWIAWTKRNQISAKLDSVGTRSSGLAQSVFLFSLITGLFLFIFGWRLEFLLVSSFSLIPTLIGMIGFMYGPGVLRILAFPIFYLLFSVPPPAGVLDSITLPMRYGISEATEWILAALGYPITRNGLLLSMEGKEIFMGAPCSGFRSLTTMITLAVGYVYFIKGGLVKKSLLIASAVPFALVGNLIRVMTLCLITFYFGQEAAEGTVHDLSGAVIFLIMIGCLMGFENLLERFGKKSGGLS